MPRTAFSTTACPDWTLARAARAAAEYGFEGVEARSFGAGSTHLVCDPALTDGAKVQRLMDDAGVFLAGIAGGCRFEAPVRPPLAGLVLPGPHRSVREAKHLIDVAADCQAPFVRVYAYDVPKGQKRSSVVRRVADRLYEVCDSARHRDVRILLENGGAFSSAEDLAELIDRVDTSLLYACYDLGAAHAAGDDVEDGVRLLGARLAAARVKDADAEGTPVPLGEGALPCAEFVRAVALSPAGRDAWITYSWDRLWRPELDAPERVLPEAARRLYEWGAGGVRGDAAA